MLRGLKQRFVNLSLKKKLTLIIMATTALALSMAYAAFIVYDIRDIKQTKVQHLNTLAEMIGYNSAAALAFSDAQDATKTLAGLAAEKNIEVAIVYTADYTSFAEYRGGTAADAQPDFDIARPPCRPGEAKLLNGDLLVLRSIFVQQDCIGYVLLQSDLAELNARVTRFVLIAFVLATLSLLTALLITFRLQRLISEPILHLAQVARRVTIHRDYSARAQGRGRDEVGELIFGFNEMLSEIQRRDAELLLAQEELQRRADELQAELLERLRAEREAARMRSYLQNVIDSMPSVMVAVDQQGRVQQWNAQAERLTELPRDHSQDRRLDEVYPALAGEMPGIYQAIRTGTPLKRERVQINDSAQERWVDIMIYPLLTTGVEGAVVRVDDATERVRMEEMMIQTEKMMSVGGLAAGMAHEINNPLGIILQSTQNVLRRIAPDLRKNVEAAAAAGVNLSAVQSYFEQRGIFEFLQDISSAGKRAATIVTNMLNFSRRTESDSTWVDLGELLRRTVDLAASDYDLKKKYDFRHIEIVYDLDPELPKLPCVETKIEQVILNLLKNAAQAIGQHGGVAHPRITCRTRRADDLARIEIEDNGPGMPEHVRRRVFEPFFTTKEVGTGTGLGLSVSYFIITDNHKGSMEVESTEGVGAKFIIRLPLSAASSPVATASHS